MGGLVKKDVNTKRKVASKQNQVMEVQFEEPEEKLFMNVLGATLAECKTLARKDNAILQNQWC